jgi:hypothetical protein
MSVELPEAVGYVAGGGGVVWLVRLLVDRFVTRADKVTESVEHGREAKLDAVLVLVTKMERELSLVSERQTAQAALVSKVEERINGISSSYAPRLARIEEQMARIDERMVAAKRGRR